MNNLGKTLFNNLLDNGMDMLIEYERAVAVFNGFGKDQKIPHLHPYYVVADARRNATLTPAFFAYEEDASIFYHPFHVAPVAGTGLADIQSAYGYGGPLISSEDPEFPARAWAAHTSWCTEHNMLAEFIRFHPLLDNWCGYDGEVVEERETVWINLCTNDLSSTYRELARRGVRKAKRKGLTVEWWGADQFIKIFPLFYDAFMTEMNADTFYHFTDEYFEGVLPWEKAHCAVCKLGDEIVTAGVFLADGDIMEYHLSASCPAARDLGSVYLLMHEAALRGQQIGCRALHLGGGTDNGSDNPLLFFKSRFSDLRCVFRIGKKVYAQQAYNQLKSDWQERCGVAPRRVLFYR
jgi:hypothetical protein